MRVSPTTMTKQSSWFSIPKPVSQPKLRLFCFSYAGGNASTYREWHKQLPDDVEVCSIQLPGRGARFKEQAYTNLDSLLSDLIKEIQPYTDVPYVLFGHSMGAQVAFELAREFSNRDVDLPSCLIVSGRRAPQRKKQSRPIYKLPEHEFREEIRRLNGTPSEALNNPELMEIVSPILRADFQLIETWQYEPSDPIDVPVLALGGIKDKQVSLDDLEDWKQITSGPFCLELFSGDHFFINQVTEPLLNTVRQTIDNVLGRSEGLLSRTTSV